HHCRVSCRKAGLCSIGRTHFRRSTQTGRCRHCRQNRLPRPPKCLERKLFVRNLDPPSEMPCASATTPPPAAIVAELVTTRLKPEGASQPLELISKLPTVPPSATSHAPPPIARLDTTGDWDNGVLVPVLPPLSTITVVGPPSATSG